MADVAHILVTGGTGYVGGRLIPLLERRGYSVRCLARRPEFLQPRVGRQTEVVAGDVLQAETLHPALYGIETAFYLVHSMGTGKDFEDEDRTAARNFAKAARRTGVRRIIYLGGLGEEERQLSKHLRSRQEVGQILRESGAQVNEFRASIVIGSGSLSFELIRALVQKLPVMLCPKWVATPAQPIAIEDLLSYLIAALDLPAGPSEIFEIGGPDQVSYGKIMQEYARQRALKRWMIPVPFLSPWLSSLWLGLVTPVYARIGRKLVESLRNPTLVTNSRALEAFAIRPRGVRDAIARALVNEDRELATTRWSDALSSAGQPRRWGGVRFGTRLVDSRTLTTPASPHDAFVPIEGIGGKTGWYCCDGLWQLRGWLDLLFGGVGLRRGRRDPIELNVGDTVDCWRVEAFEPDRRLRLFAEMRMPGRAWLEFEVEPTETGSRVRQTAEFDPVGLAGLAYWYLVYPLHEIVFAGMLRGIVTAGGKLPTERSTAWRPSTIRQLAWLSSLIAVCFAAAGVGGTVTVTSVGDWYQTLAKPTWTPPDWLFGPVWTVLYFLMAVSAWLVWRRTGWPRVRAPLGWFGLQLALNVGWSLIFFGMRSPGLAFAEIIGLWLFEAPEIRTMLAAATAPLKAMILLGINCGFGNTDVANLAMKNLDLEGGWCNYPRPKTGIARRCPLWSETIQAIKAALEERPAAKDKAHADLVFITPAGQQWVWTRGESVGADALDVEELAHSSRIDRVGSTTGQLLIKLGLARRGHTFYALRHTFETIGGESRDQVAVDAIMGHSREDMASVYRERIGDDRLQAVVEHVRKWLLAKLMETIPQSPAP